MTANSVLARAAIIAARLIFAGVFAMSMWMKFTDINATAGYIAMVGFPLSVPLAWLAAFFELGLAIAFLSGAFFREATVAGAAYVLFLAIVFHGPAGWAANPMDFGFFVDHFTFIAGLLFAAVQGPGKIALHLGIIGVHDRPTPARA